MKQLEHEIEAILSQLTLEEKAGLCSGQDDWTSKVVERLGVPALWYSDGPHGVRRAPTSNTGGYGDQLPATCYPTASAMAATWDRELIRETGEHLALECQALKVNVLLGPGVNIKRSPLGGRNFEYLSEDPVLSGEMGAAYIQGVQSQNVGTSLKHFACNSQETRRMVADSTIDERTLREVYLRNFEIAVKKAKPWTVMAAYNPVNGTDATAHKKLLWDILREEWGYEGIVVSDWVSVYDRPAGVAAGLNLEMPGAGGFTDQKIVEAVKGGTLDEALLDRMVRQILAITLVGKRAQVERDGYDHAAHHSFARKLAGEAIVLLKNDAGLLPIDPKKSQRIALIGEFADTIRFQGNGSSEVKPTQLSSLRVELAAHLGPGASLEWEPGYSSHRDQDTSKVAPAVSLAQRSDIAILHLGLPNSYESEGVDRKHMDLPPAMVTLLEEVLKVQKNVVVVLTNGTCVTLPFVDKVPAIVEAWLGGQAGAGAIADVLVGLVNPSGKLAETFPLRIEDTPSYLDLPAKTLRLPYSEGVFVGYRWYDKRKIPVLFPFGHGLSYTTFAYSNVKLSSTGLKDHGSLEVRCTITNTGARRGKEVVQLYIHDPESSLLRPLWELKDFTKVDIEAGESREVSFTLTQEALSFYHDGFGRWLAESGEFVVALGSSSRDLRAKATFTYDADLAIEHGFTERTIMADWISFPELKAGAIAVIKPFFDMAQGLIMGNYDDFKVSNGFFMDMPIIKYARLSNGAISEQSIRDWVRKAATIKVKI